jgi:hypothetical protein
MTARRKQVAIAAAPIDDHGIARVRKKVEKGEHVSNETVGDLLARLDQEIARRRAMEEAAKPFVRAAADVGDEWPDTAPAIRWRAGRKPWTITVGHFRGLRAAIGNRCDD